MEGPNTQRTPDPMEEDNPLSLPSESLPAGDSSKEEESQEVPPLATTLQRREELQTTIPSTTLHNPKPIHQPILSSSPFLQREQHSFSCPLQQQEHTSSHTSPLEPSQQPDIQEEYRKFIVETANLKLKDPQKMLGDPQNEIIGDCDWVRLTKHTTTTKTPPPPMTNSIGWHPRRWYYSEKQANYRRLLAPNAEEFLQLILSMDIWEISM